MNLNQPASAMEEMKPYTAPAPEPEVISVGNWVLTILITFIPIVNIVMFFVWGFGDNTNPNKANWAKAQLIWIAIAISIYVIIFMLFGAAFLFGM